MVSTLVVTCSIPHDRAAVVAHPIGEAEVVNPHIVKPGARCSGCGQGRPPAAFAMGYDVIALAESHLLQHGAQYLWRTHDAVVQQVGVRQMPCARQMPATRALAHVLSGELRARTAIEHMRVAVELTLE